jgi:hypothetical protein
MSYSDGLNVYRPLFVHDYHPAWRTVLEFLAAHFFRGGYFTAMWAKTPPEKAAKTAIQFSESFAVDGHEMYKHICSPRLDGWFQRPAAKTCVKKTCAQRETLSIAGFSLKVNKFDGIHFGRLKRNDLVCAGKVDHGFDNHRPPSCRRG